MARNPSAARPGKSAPGASPRLVLVAAALAALVILGAGVFLALALRDNPRGAAGTVLASAIGGPFRLTDQNGKTVTDADLKGKWLLVYFGYTHCPDACPTALNNIAAALDELGPRRSGGQPLFITLDHERDTVPMMKDNTAAVASDLIGLTGTQEQVGRAARAYRVYAKKHPTGT